MFSISALHVIFLGNCERDLSGERTRSTLTTYVCAHTLYIHTCKVTEWQLFVATLSLRLRRSYLPQLFSPTELICLHHSNMHVVYVTVLRLMCLRNIMQLLFFLLVLVCQNDCQIIVTSVAVLFVYENAVCWLWM